MGDTWGVQGPPSQAHSRVSRDLRAVTALLPVCFCDACDEDSESLVEQAEEYVRVVTAGFVELRRPYRTGFRRRVFSGPSMEVGYREAAGSGSSAGIDITGEPFTQQWSRWLPRRARTS